MKARPLSIRKLIKSMRRDYNTSRSQPTMVVSRNDLRRLLEFAEGKVVKRKKVRAV